MFSVRSNLYCKYPTVSSYYSFFFLQADSEKPGTSGGSSSKPDMKARLRALQMKRVWHVFVISVLMSHTAPIDDWLCLFIKRKIRKGLKKRVKCSIKTSPVDLNDCYIYYITRFFLIKHLSVHVHFWESKLRIRILDNVSH